MISLSLSLSTVGFETNLHNNVECKKAKYRTLIEELKQSRQFTSVDFVNLSVSCLGVFDKECYSLLKLLNAIGVDKKHQEYCFKKIASLAIRSTYL